VTSRKDRRELEGWARRAMKGVKESASFLQLYRAIDDPSREPEYVLQLGAAVLPDKPIVIIAPEGLTIPPKLLAIADSVQFYVDGDATSCELAIRRALEAIGVVKH
jgi:hypothetical protein